VIWGSAGTNGQHSYFQQLHQGTELIPVEFIALASPSTTRLAQGQGQGESENENEKGSERDSGAEQQAMLLANCLSQSWALMRGDDGSGDPHRNIPGNRPSTTLLLDSLTPASLGMLIALYEHRVFALSVLWNINAFDQWGVELGKRLAQQVLTALESQPSSAALDPSTAQLIARIRASRAGKK
jgi:glucose-6-phosphate isomerase